MDAKDVNSEEFIEELISCGEFPFKLNAYQAYICVCMFQLALKHPGFKPEDATYKTGNTIARFLHGELAKRSTLVGEVLEKGWDEYFMLDIQFDEEEQKVANLSDLIPRRQNQLALLAKAFEVLVIRTSKLKSLPRKEVIEDAMARAVAIINKNPEKLIRETIKELDDAANLD